MRSNYARLLFGGAASVLALVLGACSTPSINPIYSEDQNEVVQDDRVVGLWIPDDTKKEKDRYRVTAIERPKPAANQSGQQAAPEPVYYKLTIEDEAGNSKKNSEFELRLVRLAASDFIDVYPANNEVRSLGDRYAMAALPMHIIMPVVLKDDHVTVRPLELGKVKSLLEESPGMTPHAVRDKDVVILTGSSRQVQEFFRRIVGDDAVFAEPLLLTRAPSDGKAAATPAKPEPAKPPMDKRSRKPVRTR